MPTPIRIRPILAAGAAIACLAVLPGCVAAVASASGAASGYSAAQERSVTDQGADVAIKSQIVRAWDKYNYDLPAGLGVDVYEGRVLLTGRVPNPDWRDQAVTLAWQVKGVKDVFNEIEVGPVSSTGDNLSDTWITTRLRNEVLWDGDIRSLNYTITTSDRVIYLTGSARDQTELDRVTNYARNIPNVKRVVSYVKIRIGEPATSTSTSTSAPAPAPAGSRTDAGAAAPQHGVDRIEMKPLQ